jgi:hypothetical protein
MGGGSVVTESTETPSGWRPETPSDWRDTEKLSREGQLLPQVVPVPSGTGVASQVVKGAPKRSAAGPEGATVSKEPATPKVSTPSQYEVHPHSSPTPVGEDAVPGPESDVADASPPRDTDARNAIDALEAQWAKLEAEERLWNLDLSSKKDAVLAEIRELRLEQSRLAGGPVA